MADMSSRPVYHFIAPRGWMNDPCAPGFDPRTGLFHLFYQWTPHSHRWDRIAWGHATSRDLLRWTHAETPVIAPDTAYDKEGVFTGCFWPAGPKGEDGLTVVYTNVCAVPIHYDKPYTRGCEGLALATSEDGGVTWTKHSANPVLPEEPVGLDVTGFRDPFLAPWPAMDRARGTTGRLYGLISGGIRDIGPCVFLYDVDPADMTAWTYLSPITFPSYKTGLWGGDLGVNLECTNFLTLAAGRIEREVLVTGSEGGVPRFGEARVRRAPWVMGTLASEGNEVGMQRSAAGVVDWGALYAFNTFEHKGRHILWGWLMDEELPDAILAKRGWTGCLGVPRELFLASYAGVASALASKIEDVGCFERLPSGEVVTLGMRPVTELANLRGERVASATGGPKLQLDAPLTMAINLEVEITDETEAVELRVRCSRTVHTSIIFSPQAEVIRVVREHSNAQPDIRKSTEEGRFTLLRMPEIEKLQMIIFLDADVLEVFANDRFALSTRVYSPKEATGVEYEHKGLARVERLEVWEMQAADAT
ncbi:Arabinanase/levansucrase/invertase [Cutaneotrichosporon oleaginosum]|uniref:Arabinanase/levansucrase/invertase n=1 Tax=Cutaneotrichosporon oleaginosum TaxID=879819 RepID=A0A0J0XN97_9TREE|nr:Arabinanase/levansucrase/invertase [Cutaneotrichosporon oleaginosum]KLT42611.1 Arabinanase/levansucrase/invertase [Cutaneotrichosporon oleaginosum]TXT05272.1 hypothetical protein COLE_06592 [Cutaneotrichosporon oleaginosum]